MDPVSDAALLEAVEALETGAVRYGPSFLRRYGFEDMGHFFGMLRAADTPYRELFSDFERYSAYRSGIGRWLNDVPEFAAAARSAPNAERSIWSMLQSMGDAYSFLGPAARWIGHRVGAAVAAYEAYEHGSSALITPSNTQPPYDPTPTTPAGPAVAPDQDIITGSADHGHSFLGAQSMPFGNASYGGRFGGRSRFKSGYPANQSRRQTEEFGDLNGHNRIFQFYNYHGEKKQLLDEYCRGLILSLLRIQKGTILDYEEPIAWPYPVYHGDATVPADGVEGVEPAASLKPGMDIHLDYIEFHFKDNRRGTGNFGQTLSSAPLTRLPVQYRADYDALGLRTVVQLWKQVGSDANSPDRVMKSIQELAADMANMFEEWAYLGDEYVRPELTTIDDLDFVPVRVLLVKRTEVNTAAGDALQTYDVVYDDDQLGSSRVDVGVHTTVTLHNVSPAAGDIVSNPDPLTADTINHVPLVGKMYTFSGPVPKVWDKHRDDLHELFNPDFFKIGRYRLPKSKLESLEEFKSPPRGRAIWSNCIGESRIMIGPGQIKKLRMDFRVRCSFAEFWQKYRNQYLADTKMGRCVCLCLEPMIRRQHVGEPINRQLMKTRDENNQPIQRFIDIPPYEFQLSDDPLVKPAKVLRKLFNFAPMASFPYQGVQFWYHKYHASNDGWRKLKTVTGGGTYQIDVDGYPIYAGLTVDASTHTPFTLTSYNAVAPLLIDPLQYDSVTDKCPERWGHTIPAGVADPGANVGSVGVWPAPWTAHVSGTAIGDPMMFNIQINRMLHGRTWLKKKHILGADKSGIKRKWDERLTGNLGDVAMFNEDGTLNADYKKDAPRDIDMIPGAGVPVIIPQGEEGNLTVQATGAVGGGLTQAEAEAAFTNALTSAVVLQHHGHSNHPLSGLTTTGGKLAVDAGTISTTTDFANHPLAGINMSGNGAILTQSHITGLPASLIDQTTGAIRILEQNPQAASGTVTIGGISQGVTIPVAEQNPQAAASTVTIAGVNAGVTIPVAEQNPVTAVQATVTNPVTSVGVTGNVSVTETNPVTSVGVTGTVAVAEQNPQAAASTVTIGGISQGVTIPVAEQNPVTSVGVTGTVAVAEQNPVTNVGITGTVPVQQMDTNVYPKASLEGFVLGWNAHNDSVPYYGGFQIKLDDGTNLINKSVYADGLWWPGNSGTSMDHQVFNSQSSTKYSHPTNLVGLRVRAWHTNSPDSHYVVINEEVE